MSDGKTSLNGFNKPTFNIRDTLGSVEAIKKYEAYLADHGRRLRQLEKEARGDMAPSDEWYRE
jgi:hypothetical protein